jgi:hypothetical protein
MGISIQPVILITVIESEALRALLDTPFLGAQSLQAGLDGRRVPGPEHSAP